MPKRMTLDPKRLTPFGHLIYDYLLSFRPNKLVVELAQETGINNQTIWDWLRKGTIPQRGTIVRLANATTMPLDDLLRAAGLPDSQTNAAERRRIMREYKRILRDTERELEKDASLTPDERRLFMATLRKLGPRIVEQTTAALDQTSDESDAPIKITPPDDDEVGSSRRHATASGRR